MVMTSSALGYSAPEPEVTQEEYKDDGTRPEPPPAEQTKMKFDVLNMNELADGSLLVEVNMDYDTMRMFAKIGMMKVLNDAASKAVDEHGST